MVTGLSALFTPSEEAKFLDCFARKEVALLSGDADAIGHLVSIDEIGRLLANGTLQSPRIRVSRSGNTVPELVWSTKDGPVDVPALQGLMNKGASLIIDNLAPLVPTLLRLEHAIERKLGSQTLINAYLTEKKGGAFGAHYDNHDVLIVQVLGEKTWELFAPTERPADSRREWRQSLPHPKDVIVERQLRAGQMLLIPRGTWHRASVNDGAMSLHLTVTIISLNGHDYARWVLEQLEGDDLVCTDIPRLGGAGALALYEQAVNDRIAANLKANDLSRFLAEKDGERVPVATSGLAGFVTPDDMDLLVPAMRRRLAEDQGNGGSLEVRASGQTHRLNEAMRAALLAVDDSETGLSYGALASNLSTRWTREIVEDSIRRLTVKGLVTIKPGRET